MIKITLNNMVNMQSAEADYTKSHAMIEVIADWPNSLSQNDNCTSMQHIYLPAIDVNINI